MRLLLANQLQQDVAARLPEARTVRLWDGPQGYILNLVQPDGRRAEIKSRRDLTRLLPSKKRRKS